MSETNEKKKNKPIPIPQKAAYSIGLGGSNIMSILLSSFLTAYYTDTALIAASAVATMFLVLRVLDGVTDFVMGSLVDRTNTKIGKARPWLFAAAPLMCIGIVLILHVPLGWSSSNKLIYAYLSYIFLNCIVYTIYGISHTTLLARMTRDSQDRTLTSTVSIIFNNLVQIVGATVITQLYLNIGWANTSFILGIASGLMILVEALVCRETVGTEAVEAAPGQVQEEKVPLMDQVKAVLTCKYFWCCLVIGICTLVYNANGNSCTVYYCTYVLGDASYTGTLLGLGMAPSIAMLLITPWCTKKFSKRGFMGVCGALLVLSFALIAVAPTNKSLLLACAFLRSIGGGPMMAGVYAFIADSADFLEWRKGLRAEGLMSSSQSIGQKIGIGIGSASVLWVISAAGYVEGASTQAASVISALKFSYIWVDVIVTAILLACVLLMDVEKYLPQIHADLDAK